MARATRLLRPAPAEATAPEAGAALRSRRAVAALAVFAGGLGLLALLYLAHILQGPAEITAGDVFRALLFPEDTLAHHIVRHLRLPRATVGIVAGAALGMAGVLLQSGTRNPLASPSTLGVMAGAHLAVVAATVFLPGVAAFSPALVAFTGGIVAALFVYLVAGGVRAAPVRLILAGVAVSLALAAFTAALQLFHENETAGLFFWGAGSLIQRDWSGIAYAAPRLLAGAALALLLARHLDVLLLGDDVAQSLGQRILATRAGAILLGVFLAAVAVSVVGPVGFVGLVAPHLVRLMGFRRHLPLLLGSALWGALLLVGADVLARLLNGSLTELPVGVVTALAGAPFLIYLARRATAAGGAPERPRREAPLGNARRSIPFPLVLAGAAGILGVVAVAGVASGEVSLTTRQILEVLTGGGSRFTRLIVMEFRLPRVLVAATAGACLAASGVLLQGIVRNPLAGPEIVGATSGAGLGALAVLLAFPEVPLAAVPVAAFAGALVAFVLVYAVSWQRGRGVAPERLALVGIAISASCMAIITLLVVKSDVRVTEAIVWLSGSTYARGWSDLARGAIVLLALLPVAWVLARSLDALALGDDSARGLGVPVERHRALLLAVAVALAAAAVSMAGTIGFVGLVAPHMARLLAGSRHRRLLPLAVLLGAALVAAADLVGRTAFSPKEVPAGLVTAIIGAPYFLWLLWRSRASLAR